MMKRIIAIIMVITLVMGNNVSVLASEIGDVEQVVSEDGGTETEEGYELIIENGVVTGYTGTPVDVVIPSGVTSIGDMAFMNCSSITSVNLSENLTTIRNMAFWGCSNLAEIEIPENVTSIGSYAFF